MAWYNCWRVAVPHQRPLRAHALAMSAGGSTGGSTGESTDVSTNFVWIKLVTAKEDAFAYLEGSSLLVGQVAALACKEYTHWRLNAGQIRLHPVTVSAKEPSEEEIGAAWATGTKPLPVSAAVTSGAWLLAVPTTPDMSTSTTHSSDSILSKLLGLQVAKSEQCRLESEQWRLESTLRYVQVQRWDSHSSSMVKLRASYHVFLVKALAAAWVTSGGARLSMIRDKNWGARQPLTSENYAAFLKQSQVVGAILPDIYVFEQMTQTTLPGQPAGHEQEVGVVGKHLKGVHGGASRSRSSSIHVEFRSAVSLRDGSVCVLCRGEPPLEAAYIISRLAERPELSTALLLTPFVPNNGIMLCIPCHHLHDAFMWCFDPSKGVVVADALLNDEELGPIWRDRIGVQLSQPHAADTTKAAWWPPASVWAAAMARFEVDKAERHAEEDSSPFACGVCLKRFNRASGVTNHKCGQV